MQGMILGIMIQKEKMKTVVVVETPKGSPEKYKYDPVTGLFKLKKILPLGMVFPYPFGFIPGTHGKDGDPLDAMLISEFNAFTGAQIECRLVGALLAKQTSKGKTMRNDRFFFVPEASIIYQHVRSMNDLPAAHNRQLKEFFIQYNKIEGEIFTPLQMITVLKAAKLIG